MFVALVGSIDTEISVEFLPNAFDILFVKDNFYQILRRYYNNDTGEWVLEVEAVVVREFVSKKFDYTPKTSSYKELYIDNK